MYNYLHFYFYRIATAEREITQKNNIIKADAEK
jgi:hypothetical protein